MQNIYTNLSANEILRLAWWGIRLDGAQIKQVSLIGDISAARSAAARPRSWWPPTTDRRGGRQGPRAARAGTGGTTTASAGTTGASGDSLLHDLHHGDIDRSDFTTDVDAIENSPLWKQLRGRDRFPADGPGLSARGTTTTSTGTLPSPARTTSLDGNGKVKGAAVKMVYQADPRRGTDDRRSIMGIMETTWLDAPAASEGIRSAVQRHHLHHRGNQSAH